MTYTIRPVRPTDLAAVTEVEAICFPAAEAAAEESFKARIAAFPECFFVAEADGKIIGFINGCATDSKTIYDEMYENSACHRPDGAYQSIFGLDVIPDYHRAFTDHAVLHDDGVFDYSAFLDRYAGSDHRVRYLSVDLGTFADDTLCDLRVRGNILRRDPLRSC